jgi:hypothetical protein
MNGWNAMRMIEKGGLTKPLFHVIIRVQKERS